MNSWKGLHSWYKSALDVRSSADFLKMTNHLTGYCDHMHVLDCREHDTFRGDLTANRLNDTFEYVIFAWLNVNSCWGDLTMYCQTYIRKHMQVCLFEPDTSVSRKVSDL